MAKNFNSAEYMEHAQTLNSDELKNLYTQTAENTENFTGQEMLLESVKFGIIKRELYNRGIELEDPFKKPTQKNNEPSVTPKPEPVVSVVPPSPNTDTALNIKIVKEPRSSVLDNGYGITAETVNGQESIKITVSEHATETEISTIVEKAKAMLEEQRNQPAYDFDKDPTFNGDSWLNNDDWSFDNDEIIPNNDIQIGGTSSIVHIDENGNITGDIEWLEENLTNKQLDDLKQAAIDQGGIDITNTGGMNPAILPTVEIGGFPVMINNSQGNQVNLNGDVIGENRVSTLNNEELSIDDISQISADEQIKRIDFTVDRLKPPSPPNSNVVIGKQGSLSEHWESVKTADTMTVERGDSIWKMTKEHFDISDDTLVASKVSEVLALNGLDLESARDIQPGQTILMEDLAANDGGLSQSFPVLPEHSHS